MDSKEEMELVVKINKLLSQNNGRVSEDEVCKTFSITPYEIPWGVGLGWHRSLQPTPWPPQYQEYYLIQSRVDKPTGQPTQEFHLIHNRVDK